MNDGKVMLGRSTMIVMSRIGFGGLARAGGWGGEDLVEGK